jgi:hypothetical protein
MSEIKCPYLKNKKKDLEIFLLLLPYEDTVRRRWMSVGENSPSADTEYASSFILDFLV